jgi:hypothetical protein
LLWRGIKGIPRRFFKEESILKINLYTNKDVAKLCGCSVETVVKFAQSNEINFVGSGRRKIYIWFDEDLERFKARNTTRGRPSIE